MLAAIIKEGGLESKADVLERAREYWHFRDELSVYGGMIFRWEHLVVPQEMRAEMLHKAYSTHQGLEGNLCIARDIFAQHGIPTTLVMDNAKCFLSCEFQAFSKMWDLQHTTSSLYHP
ncbi:hypothetical protein PR048_011132 [Dryococelus australis]|uniref:Integrase catalytic domain-containing protein n=1 Tax=Dryococelus australis TaxID=614101 RepID=A0ABQ9HKS4_9NEOP|nr:hypothetical protein PR048_011132 [Dryococelus australis]